MKALGFKAQPTHAHMQDACAAAASRGQLPHFDMVISCLNVPNPDRSSIHTGLAWEVQAPILKGSRWMVVHLCRDIIRDKITSVLFYCKSGKHRSVTFAKFVIYALKQMGLHVKERHFHDCLWHVSRCAKRAYPGRCLECFGERPPESIAFFDELAQMVREAVESS